jgi:hypothetical protein
LLDAGALYAVHTGIVDTPLSRLDYLESTLSILASLFACIGLCASKRWGWFSGIGVVAIVLVATVVSTVRNFDPAAESLGAVGTVILLCAGLLAVLDSRAVRLAVSPAVPSSGFFANLPLRPLAYLALLLIVVSLIQMLWGWLVLLVWVLIIGVRRIRHSREVHESSRGPAA